MFDNNYFGIILSFAAYEIGKWINKKVKNPLANPLLIAILIIIAFLKFTGIDYEYYAKGGNFIKAFIGPATVAMVLDLYINIESLKKNFIPIIIGVGAGCIIAMTSAIILCKIFAIDKDLISSLIPQSITTAIAISLSEEYNGVIALTAICVVIRGVTGAVFAPSVVKLFKIKDPVAQGVAIGCASHAVGTSEARKMGEIQGAMSGLSIAVAGIISVFLMPLAIYFLNFII